MRCHRFSRFSILTAVLAGGCGTEPHVEDATLASGTTEYDHDPIGGSSDSEPQGETSEGADTSTDGSESDSTGSACFTGSLGCPCHRNDTCDEGLRCMAGECAAAGGTCGNGVVEDDEECDDGNDIDDDECTNACTLPTCGDGIIQAGEECDGDLSGGNDCAALGDWTEGEFVCGDDCVVDIDSCFAKLDNTNTSCTHQVHCLNHGPHAQQECFVSLDLPSPYSLSEVAYNIFTTDNPENVALEVYSWTGTAPGVLLSSQPLSTSDVEVGAHTIELSTPLQIQATSFCVGLRADGMFTMSRDPTSSAGNESFIEVPACGANAFVPISAATATGNYCIRPTLLP